jgi:hypothetical protein
VANLLTELRAHLVTAGIVRTPTGGGSLPVLWLEPRLGTPAPGETPVGGSAAQAHATAVVGAFLTNGFAPAPYMSFMRQPIVDLRIRTTTALAAEQLELAITAALIDRRDFMLGAMYVIECEQWRALQRLGSGPQGFEFVTAYWFQTLRS